MTSFRNFKDLRSYVKSPHVPLNSTAKVRYFFSRSSLVTPNLINKPVFIYNGISWRRVVINKFMVGRKIGEFYRTRTFLRKK